VNLKRLSEDEWARMSWYARQQWLLAADALRRQLLEDLDEARFQAVVADLQPDLAEARLWEATREAFDRPERRATGGSGRLREHVVEDVAWLLEQHPHITVRAIAERLGYRDQSGIQHALRRAGRRDLLERLARNALEGAA
jgi:hypothetical protein